MFQQKRICAFCGKEFIATHPSQKYCKGPHYRKCEVCGKVFEFKIPANIADARRTCSKKCATALKFKNGNPGTDPEVRKKMVETYKARTGYDHPMHNPEVVDRVKQTNLDNHDGVYAQTTQEYRDKTICTNLEKYGVEWHTQNPEVRKRITQSVLDSYGVEHISQIPEVKQKIRDTYIEHTGYDHYTHNPEAMESVRQTNLEKYGVPWAVSATEVRDKARQTTLNRYGVPNAMQNPNILDKAQKTNEERYGNKVYFLTKEGKEKSRRRMMSRYGRPKFSMTHTWKAGMMQDPSKLDSWVKFTSGKENAIEFLSQYEYPPSFHELTRDLGVTSTTISYWIDKFGLKDKVKFTLSAMEDDVYATLRSINPNLDIHRHCRNMVPGRELDLYLPDFNLGIECDPTYTHNSSFPTVWSQIPMSPRYHHDKNKQFSEVGVFVFHIFGYEWEHKRPIIESMLRSLVGCSTRHIYARQCTIKEVSYQDSKIFLERNHRQGNCRSTVRVGLYYGEELVSLMTFSKTRALIGGRDESTWELLRFCSRLNTTVVGAASKLFKYFTASNPEVCRIRSFSDMAHTRGNVYKTLGFHLVRESAPGYVWVDVNTDKAYHRMNAAKDNIRAFLKDDDIDLSRTEKQIMEEHQFAQVFDCGTKVWEWYR